MNFEDEVWEAKAILLRSLKSPSGKLLVEYPGWLKLSYEARTKAAEEFTCPLCHKIKELTGSWEHYYGTESVCKDCSDGNNPRLQKYREEFAKAGATK